MPLDGFAADAGRPTWLLLDGASVFGGHEVMLARFVGELSEQGRVVPRLLAREGSLLRERLAAHAASSALATEGSSRGVIERLRRCVSDVRVVREAIEREDPALCVLAEGCLLSQPLLSFACKLSGRPLVTYVPITDSTRSLGFRSGRIRDFLTKVLFGNLPDAWITLTVEQAQEFKRWAKLQREVFLLPNTVAPRFELEDGDARARELQDLQELRVLVLGRLDRQQKGLDLLLEFLLRHARELEGVKISLVGDGPFRAELEAAMCRDDELRAVLELVPFSDSLEALQRHDVLLVPSRFEGVPLVMLEAMAVGVPVVATALPGTRAFLPAECLFEVGELEKAFAILGGLRAASVRRAVVQQNRRRFAARASGAAFSRAVARLTDSLAALAEVKRAPANVKRRTSLGVG
jgi:glycosyltransferase involved in cell wall biosynthesis